MIKFMVEVLLEHLVVAELIKEYPAFTESKISYSYYVQFNTGFHPEPVGFRPQFYSQFIEAILQYHTTTITLERIFPLGFLSTFCMQPIILQYPAPIILQYPAPIILQYPAPIILQYPAPIILQYPAPISRFLISSP